AAAPTLASLLAQLSTAELGSRELLGREVGRSRSCCCTPPRLRQIVGGVGVRVQQRRVICRVEVPSRISLTVFVNPDGHPAWLNPQRQILRQLARHLHRLQPRLLSCPHQQGVSGALDLQAAHFRQRKLMSQHVLAKLLAQMHHSAAWQAKPRLRPPILSSDLLSLAMDREEFRRQGKAMVDFIADYFASFRQRQVVPDVRPGYLRPLIPAEPPQAGEPFENVMADLERVVLSGVTNWHHPQFHAYYPTANTFPSILADMLSDAIGCIGFSWIASPACTELETVMMDWLAKALGLPDHFLFPAGGGSGGSGGGGVIQGSASEATLVIFLSARNLAIQRLQAQQPEAQQQPSLALSRLVAYASDQSHSSVERAAMLAFVQLRKLPTDGKRSLRGDTLARAVAEDRARGLEPILLITTLGTTNSCAFDNLAELGEVCQSEGLWCHVDAAYAGASLICPEYRHIANGIELADSFNFNPGKWLQITFDCSALWLKDSSKVVDTFNVDPLYLQHEFSGQVPDYRIWFVLRSYGIEGLQSYIRKHIRLAKQFEELVTADDRFEIVEEVVFGLGANAPSRELYRCIREDGRIHLIASEFEASDTFFIRFAVCSEFCEAADIRYAYDVISELANEVLSKK
uniref:Aromatic-L-amino-acid decarboxylase n=2 Tax=Macrostomum lignano TaxID=282301 RepID=A0A1I8IWA1_9PLAT